MTEREKLILPSRYTRCLKCGKKLKYAFPAHKTDGTRDFLLKCHDPECAYIFTVGEKIDETQEREFLRLKELLGGDKTIKLGV